MPADHTLPQEPSIHHGDGRAPYPCASGLRPPGAPWSMDYGYCRTSLDLHADGFGSSDPRCPKTCSHKAPASLVESFSKQFEWRGAGVAAEHARIH